MKISGCPLLGGSMAFLLMAVAGCGDKVEAPSSPTGPAATPEQSAPTMPAPEPADATLTIDLRKQGAAWTGDLDGMIERRVIRVLTVNSKTIYFVDKGVLRGTAVDYGRLFEEELNKKLAAEKKLKNKNLKVRVVFIPVQRDQLLPALAAGKGDIAAAGLTITPERRKQCRFLRGRHDQRQRGGRVGPCFAENRQPRTISPEKRSSCASRRAYYESLVGAQQEICRGEKAAGDAR